MSAKQKSKGGRPRTVVSEEQLIEIEALASVCNQVQIADYLGIAERTFRDIMERQEEVSAAYKRGRAKAIARVGRGLLQAALNGDSTSRIFYLKTQAGWSEKIAVENEFAGDVNLFLNGTQIDPEKLNW